MGQMVTQADVARAAGVSRGLVSLALNGSPSVASSTRERILATAEQLGYRPNATAASLASGRSGLIGLLLPDLRNPFFDFVAHALQEAVAQRGMTLLVTVGAGARASRRPVDALLALRVEGLVLVSPALSDEELRGLGEACPVCLIGRCGPGGRVDTIRLDERAAAEAVISHLVRAGAGRLVYVCPDPEEDPNATERGQALAAAARQRGLRLDTVVDDVSGVPGLREQLVLAGAPGVVAHNDIVALDALSVIRSSGRGGPSGVAPLVSYDDTYLASREEFSLTSVEQPVGTMARDAVRFVCERSGREGDGEVGGARNVTVAPVLAVRRSSSPGAGPSGA
ncbi:MULTISPECIES: LacI family DNA-binding transcriptional regulator [unclassified Actinomyces]|uniref:LacI family DNA-binding transcriptional regulator n=1 Tax=unclassified Actinomyces TaxID=2609248 RepID=UPI0020174F6D|nr:MULTISPECIES: LacI family DNA-binding transcriptional regulator [unclassified Actinomyces]MCL3777594.1 LacI family DNA-binding transcriptional regulator [Actinomyces sp. AC-20-1]MCL3790497.1 LacI family DNA-binding transcriptional regulator [Actinomyces sp. 187325]MCL3791206.1 LacI family DNA-binding transcriptional regulator [Actinomyces sp. 186855]MCL3794473.1 LacI family DNA-binding transcriptional regulator [Actinomyces sp. 217892]